MNDETGPNESQMVSNEGHGKNGWRTEPLEHRLSKLTGWHHSIPYHTHVTPRGFGSAKQWQLSYYIHLNCIGFAIWFALNL